MKLAKVKKISKSKSKTYDIEVKKNHNFFCNNHLIHNCNYRGEIGATLINLEMLPTLNNINTSTLERIGSKYNSAMGSLFGADGAITFNPGDRIAQLIIEKCADFPWYEVDELPESDRGQGGFGSSGA